MQSPTKLRAGIIGLALSFYLLLQVLAQFPNFVERYYSNGLYPILTVMVTSISSQFSFSLTEVFLWLLVVGGIPFVIQRIKNKHLTRTRVLLNLLTTFAVFYVWFYLFWGINYLRPPLKSKLQLDRVQLQLDAFDSTFVHIIEQANTLNLSYPIESIAEIDSIIDTSFDRVLHSLGLRKIGGYRSPKTLFANWVLDKTTTSGWFSPFLHEVHYNADLLIVETPFVTAHEKAHQMGYTSEADANFLAHLVCISSDDPLSQYSGYFQILGYFLGSLQQDEAKYARYLNKLSTGVQLDLTAVQERWKSHRGFISKASNKAYDLYLKANRVEEGIVSYSRVVDLLVKYYEMAGIIRNTPP